MAVSNPMKTAVGNSATLRSQMFLRHARLGGLAVHGTRAVRGLGCHRQRVPVRRDEASVRKQERHEIGTRDSAVPARRDSLTVRGTRRPPPSSPAKPDLRLCEGPGLFTPRQRIPCKLLQFSRQPGSPPETSRLAGSRA